MRRSFSTLLSLLLCAGLLAACENPFATTYRPVTTAPLLSAVSPEEISLREVDDLAAAEAELKTADSSNSARRGSGPIGRTTAQRANRRRPSAPTRC